MSEKLKNCPFCGSVSAPRVLTVAEADRLEDDSEDYEWACAHWVAVCASSHGGCGAATGIGYVSEDAAAEAWNRRNGKDG